MEGVNARLIKRKRGQNKSYESGIATFNTKRKPIKLALKWTLAYLGAHKQER